MDEKCKRANGSAFLSRRKGSEEESVEEALESRCRSVFALTRWRLVHGYPNERKATHGEHLWSLPASLLFFFTLLRLPLTLSLSLPRYNPGGPQFCYLPVLLLTADRSGSTGRFKGISTIFDSGIPHA